MSKIRCEDKCPAIDFGFFDNVLLNYFFMFLYLFMLFVLVIYSFKPDFAKIDPSELEDPIRDDDLASPSTFLFALGMSIMTLGFIAMLQQFSFRMKPGTAMPATIE